MADGRIVIDTRINNKGAEADLRALQAKCKATSQELGAVGRELEKASSKRTQMAANLEAARKKAEETAQALEEVNTRLDVGYHSKFGQVSEKDVALSDSLSAKLQEQDANVAQITTEYQKQQAVVADLTARQAALNTQLGTETAAANQAADTYARQMSMQKRLDKASKAASGFGKRLLGLGAAAFVFNVISAGLRAVVKEMGTALLQTQSVKTAFAQLKGATATAAAGLANILAPAVTFVLNLLNALMNAFIRLLSLISGKSVAALKKQGKAIAATGGAAKKAAGQLAAFDELNVLNKKDSGGGADFSGVGQDVAALSAAAEKLKAGFDAAFSSARAGLANLKADAAKVGDALREIWANPAVASAVADFTQSALFALGQLAGSVASVGVSVGENLVGGLARYLDAYKPYIAERLAGLFSVGGDLAQLLGNTAQALADIFRSLGSEGAKQLTAGLLGTLGNALLGMAQTLGNTLQAVLVPLLQPIIDNAVKIRDVLSGALAVIAPFFQGAAQGVADFYTALDKLYNEVVLPVSKGISDVLSGSLGICLDALLDVLEAATGTSDGLHALGVVVGWVVGGITAAIAVFAAIKLTIAAVTAVLTAAKLAAAAFGLVMAALNSPFALVALAIGAVIAAGVALYKNWDTVKARAAELVADLKNAFEGLKEKLQAIFQGIGDFFSAIFTPILNTINTISGAAASGGASSAKPSRNGRSTRSVLRAAPSADLTALPVPALAGGAVIPANRRFLAMLGDQTSGTNVEAPLDTIKQAVAEVLNGFAGGGEQPINIYIGEELLDTVIAGSQRRRAVRSGGR